LLQQSKFKTTNFAAMQIRILRPSEGEFCRSFIADILQMCGAVAFA
jgi:hypothetical protein